MAQETSIEQLNQTLEEKLAELKGATDQDAARNIAVQLNAILYSAIAEHPAEVDAVEIQLRADVSRDHIEELATPNSRGVFREYLKLLQHAAELPGVASSTFREHLPYHRNPRLSNMQSPVDTTQFNYQNQFTIDLTGGYGNLSFSQLIDFLPSEIISIKLVDADESGGFRPHLGRVNNKLQIVPSPSALEHYLYSLGFTSYNDGLLLPHPDLRLLSVDYMSVHGYAAARQDDGEVVLYQFRNIWPQHCDETQIPEPMRHKVGIARSYDPTRHYEGVANGLLKHIIADETKYYSGITIYRGKGAIERLFQASKEIMTCREVKNF